MTSSWTPCRRPRLSPFSSPTATPGTGASSGPSSQRERMRLKRASWADSVSERMGLLDQVWRGITIPVPPPRAYGEAELVQIVRVEGEWAYPIYLTGEETRVLPTGGIPISELKRKLGGPLLDLGGQKASAEAPGIPPRQRAPGPPELRGLFRGPLKKGSSPRPVLPSCSARPGPRRFDPPAEEPRRRTTSRTLTPSRAASFATSEARS